MRLLVIDSVAAPFRCEFPGPDAAPRARLLQALGATLRQLSYTHGSPVLCINQARLQGMGQSEQGVGDPGTMLTSGPCRYQRPWMSRTQLAQQGECGRFLGARGGAAPGSHMGLSSLQELEGPACTWRCLGQPAPHAADGRSAARGPGACGSSQPDTKGGLCPSPAPRSLQLQHPHRGGAWHGKAGPP